MTLEVTRMSTVRLSEEMREKIRRVAAMKGLTISEVHRLALEQYCERELALTRKSRYDDVIGAAEGPPDLSARTGERFTELLAEKHG
jgi:hypothetical protein